MPSNASEGPSPNRSRRLGWTSRMWRRAISAQASRSLIAHPRARRVEAGERRAVGVVGGDPDRGEHALGQRPGVAADRLAGRGILERRPVAEQHHRGIFRSVGCDPPRGAGRERQVPRCLPASDCRSARVSGARFGDIRRGRGSCRLYRRWRRRSKPVARILLDGDVHSRIEPPGQCAACFGDADFVQFPAHNSSLTAIDAMVKEWAGQTS